MAQAQGYVNQSNQQRTLDHLFDIIDGTLVKWEDMDEISSDDIDYMFNAPLPTQQGNS